MSKVIGSNLAKLESAYALEIACNLPQYLQHSIQTAPSCPRSGELYLFATEFPLKKDNWKYDNLKWINNSSRTCQRGNFLLKLHYFTINIGLRNRGLFFKQVYTTQVNDLYIALIYYHGDNDHAIKLPHAHKSKLLNIAMKTTPKEDTIVETKTKNNIMEEQRAYNELLVSPATASTESTSLHLQYSMQLDEDLDFHRQVNTIDGQKRKMYTLALQEKSEQFPNLIYAIMSIPKLVILFGYNDLIQEFRHLLRTHPKSHEINISLDCVLRLDYFYVTPIYINYPRFLENPTFPVLFLLHETRCSQAYNILFSGLSELIPELLEENYSIKLDKFDGILSIAKKHFPNLDFQIRESATSPSSRNLNEMINNMLPSNSIEPLEFVEAIIEYQKEILSEISRSYKSKGSFHLESNQASTIPATYLNNNIYQILKVKEITTQSSQESIQISGETNWCQSNTLNQETGNMIKIEDKYQSLEEQVYNSPLVIAEPSLFIPDTQPDMESTKVDQL